MALPNIPILDEQNRLLLCAATAPDEFAVPAFRRWRASVDFDLVTGTAHRVMPALAALAARNGIDDPEMQRIRGIDKHVWATNMLKLKNLMLALDVLGKANVTPMLLKGGALFARMPELAARRTAADYDILVPPGQFATAAAALDAAGFVPMAMSWRAVLEENGTIDTSGTALGRGTQDALVDLHWRPLKYLDDPVLIERLFAAAETVTLKGVTTLAPSPTHHLFLSIARSDPHDKTENFQRLLEGHMLLAGLGQDSIDWDELAELLRYYGLDGLAASYVGELERTCRLDLSAGAAALASGATPGGWVEVLLRNVEPEKRLALQSWYLSRRDHRYHRAGPATLRGLGEAMLLGLLRGWPGVLPALRRSILRRLGAPLVSRPVFIEGWFYPEEEGRWSNGRLGVLALPLTEAQQAGEPVRFRGHTMRGRNSSSRLRVSGGASTERHDYGAQQGPDFDLSVVVRPEPQLGGAGLVLFWAPDAISPLERGDSDDSRRLGVFLRTNQAADGGT
jgi:hypothetical protein